MGDEGTATVEHDEPSLPCQFLLGPADYVAAYAVLLCQVQFARQPVIHGQNPRADVADQIVIDLLPQQPWGTMVDVVSFVWQGHR